MYIELDIVYSYCVDKIFTSVLFSNSRTVWEKIRFITFLDFHIFSVRHVLVHCTK